MGWNEFWGDVWAGFKKGIKAGPDSLVITEKEKPEVKKQLEESQKRVEENKEKNGGNYDPFEVPIESLTGMTMDRDTIFGMALIALVVIGLIKG